MLFKVQVLKLAQTKSILPLLIIDSYKIWKRDGDGIVMWFVTSADVTKLDGVWQKALCVQQVPDLELIQQEDASLQTQHSAGMHDKLPLALV